MSDTQQLDTAPGAKPGFSALAGMLSRESFMAGPMPSTAPAIDSVDTTTPLAPANVEQEAEELTVVQQAVRTRFARVGQELGMSDFAEAATAVLTDREALIVAGQPRSAGHRRFGGEQKPASSAAAGPKKSMLTLRAGLTQVLSDPKQLPTVPLVYQKLSRLVDDPNASVNQVSEVVSGDPASASRLLQVVNSPFYGMRKKVDTISFAVKLLGFQTVKDLVLAITAEGMFKAPPGIDPKAVEQLWYHSIGAGVAAKIIGRRMRAPDLEQFFVAGLLHDIGKMILLRSAAEAFQATLEVAAQDEILFLDAESAVTGINHAAIGAMLAEKWGFPPSLAEAVSLHHRPDQAKTHPLLAAAVHVADLISRALEIGSGGDALIPALNPAAQKALGLDAAKVKDIMEEVEQEYPDVEANLTGGASQRAAA